MLLAEWFMSFGKPDSAICSNNLILIPIRKQFEKNVRSATNNRTTYHKQCIEGVYTTHFTSKKAQIKTN